MMYKGQYTIKFKPCIHTVFTCLFICVFFVTAKGQTNNEEVKRLQRAIFVYNFAEQVSWENIEEHPTFKIGVLGPDRTILDLQSLAQKRTIHKKPVEIVRFHLIKNIKDVQVLYVNHKFNYDIYYILSKISGNNILLISEDYNFNSSMINMVNVDDSFEYEINSNRLANEGFLVAPSLKKYAITSSEKWKRLYQKTERSLQVAEEDNKEKEALIKDKEQKIENQQSKISDQLEKIGDQQKELSSKQNEITRRNQRIEKLYTEGEIQQKKYEEKIAIEQELEKNIREQITFIKTQEEKIKRGVDKIREQEEFLKRQNSQIKTQEKVLADQASELDLQRKINILLISVAVLILIAGLFIYKGYVTKKKLNATLEKKNQAIYKQSLELESKNKDLEQFAYIASHDLQEPLNTISSFIGLIAEDYEDSFDEVGKESLVFIKDASVRMKKLIDALLEYSRLGRSREYTDIDCNVLLTELKADLKTIIDKTDAEFLIDKLPIIKGSEIEIRLLFQNLISNAIKFRAEETVPNVRISCTKRNHKLNNFWEFSVQDNGIGIPEQHKERIFAIFQRLHSRDQYQGTGIGLAHCKKIVESHGGDIWLESIEGEGSTFYFTIPL